MEHDSAIVFSGIAPHPPIMVPEVGGESAAEVRNSIRAMAELTRRIVQSGAETVVLISPHAPLDARAFVAYQTAQLLGDFANFRAPETRLEFPLDLKLLEAITQTAAGDDYEVLRLSDYKLDHGAAVPLYFLDRYGWRGRVVVLGYSFLANEDHLKFGSCIAKAAEATGRSLALVASGDLSHRLKPNAPAGYNPAAYRFDEEVVAAIHDNSPGRIVDIDPDLRRTAGECGFRSMLVVLGATRGLPRACEVLHYEAPFGVGYLVAQLTNAQTVNVPHQTDRDLDAVAVEPEDADLPALARLAVETLCAAANKSAPRGHQLCLPRAPVALFRLRLARPGSPATSYAVVLARLNLRRQTWLRNDRQRDKCATRDPRFSPVSAAELPQLRYSVDVLEAPEPAALADLDPKVYGVIVEDESETLRGLLLPDIAGVDTVAKQVEIAARKAGIAPGDPLKLSRFRVNRYREK